MFGYHILDLETELQILLHIFFIGNSIFHLSLELLLKSEKWGWKLLFEAQELLSELLDFLEIWGLSLKKLPTKKNV